MRVLLVRVWVAVIVVTVSVMSGKVMVRLAVIDAARVRVVAVDEAEVEKPIVLVESVPSMKITDPILRDLLERVSVVVLATRVSVEVGKVMVPVLVTADMTGGEEKVLTPAKV